MYLSAKKFLSCTLLAGTLLLSACATHRLQVDDVEMLPGYALPPSQTGELYELAGQVLHDSAPEESAFLPLSDNLDSLRWRLLLTDMAQESIDLQYYVWGGDQSSALLGLHLLAAADRGVHVRLLLDDVFLLDLDDGITVFDSHPNIEVRVFNPWQKRGSWFQRGREYLGYMNRLNQRMHNKLFVADNRAAIVGGRNIGNAYFGLSKKYNFRDMEVLALGTVVEDISDSFDLYWNDDWATPGAAFSRPGREYPSLDEVRRMAEDKLIASKRLADAGLGSPSRWRSNLDQLVESSSTGPVWVVYDDPPSSVVDDTGTRKVEKLADLDDDISRELIIASPYFIPTDVFMEALQGLIARGVQVKVLTNSLASTNHTMVNSGYRPWRRKLIEAGVELYEYRADAEDSGEVVAEGVNAGFQSLHSKTFVIDREFVYVGSLNMDPRSFHINTEMGLLIYDEVLAGRVAAMVEADMQPRNAWRVELDESGRLVWTSSAGTRYRQPARHFGQRFADFFYGLLPIQGQL